MSASKKPPTAMLQQWYHREGLTFRQIAERCGVHQQTVGEWFKADGLQARAGAAAQQHLRRTPAATELRRLYVDEGLTAGQIAARTGAAESTVRNHILHNGIKKRQSPPTAELRRLYLDEGLSGEAIGVRVGLSATNVRARLRRAGVPMRPNGPRPRGWAVQLGGHQEKETT